MKTQFFKSALCLLLVLSILLPLGGCGKEKYPTFEDGQYIDTAGEVMDPQEVTLDVIANAHYQMNYDELTKSEERRHVVTLYLEHHVPASGKEQSAGKAALIGELSDLDLKMPEIYGNQLDSAQNVLSQGAAALSLAEIYAEIKDDAEFGKFIGKLSEKCEIADVALKFGKACYIVSDLATNDVNDREEYCEDVIEALSFITSHVPIFDEYFSQTLDLIKSGLQLLIKNYTAHETHLGVLDMEIEEGTFFSAHNFEWILIPARWKFRSAPSIELILRNDDLFDTIPRGPVGASEKEPEKDPDKDPYEYFKEYVLDRVRREVTNDFEEEESAGNESSSNSGTTSSPSTQPQTGPKPDIEPNPYRPTCAEDKHSWKSTKVLKQPTCIEEGIESMTCTNCWATMEKPIPMVDHAYEEEVIPPTTEKMGYSLFTCKVCGKSYQDKITDPIPRGISGTGNWYGEGKREHSKTSFFKLRVDSVSEGYISGYLDVYTIILGEHKTIHQTTFTGTGQATEDGYVYLLKFDQSVTFGVVPAYTYAEMKLYYKSEKDIYAFEGMYDVVMKRT